MVDWEETLKVLPHFFFVEFFLHFINTEVVSDFFKQYFEEHSSCCCGGFWFKNDDLKHSPIDSESEKEMAEQCGKISDFIDLKFEYCVVMVDERLDEQFLVQVINGAEPFSQKPEKVLIDSFHHAALNNHVNEFIFVTLGYVHFE